MGLNLKQRVIGAGLRGIAASGADRWLAPVARGRGLILTFHHVRPTRSDPFTPEHLDRTLTLVRRLGFEIVPLDEVPGRLAGPDGPPFVALTFDDGYRDNAEHALPVLQRHGAPWTLFVTADYASGHGRLWWLELEEVVRRSERLLLPTGAVVQDLPSATPEEKGEAFATAYAILRSGPEEVLRDTIGRWCEEAGIDVTALVRRFCLGWDGLAELAREPGITIGAHTLSHPMLAKHEEGRAWLEIEGGRATVADKLGIDVRHLAYPVGDPSSAGPQPRR